MSRFVIDPAAADRIARERLTPAHHLVALSVLRSHLLARLYADVRRGDLTVAEARARLDHLRGLKIRLLSDRVSQRVAWDVAERLDAADTYDAEYIAVTQLQADALVALDPALARAARPLVDVVPFGALSRPAG